MDFQCPNHKNPIIISREHSKQQVKKVVAYQSDGRNPLLEYLTKIQQFWINNYYQAKVGYFNVQRQITEKMRNVCIKYQLQEETLFLSVNILDRFLEKQQVSRQKLQLYGITCLMIAAKYQELKVPSIDELVSVTANSYKQRDIIQAEQQILQEVKFKLTTTSPLKLLYKNNPRLPKEFERCVIYLLELCLLDVSYLKYTPLQLMTSCVILSYKTCSHLFINGFKDVVKTKENVQLAQEILYFAKKKIPYNAIKNKYPEEIAKFQILEDMIF